MTDFTYEQEFFDKHVTYWYELYNELNDDWGKMARVPDLPPFSPEFDGTLNDLIPALNESFNNIESNLLSCTVATGKMGDLLLETGRAYGVTEDHATELANKVQPDG